MKKFVVLCAICLFLFVSCAEKQIEPISRTEFLLDTICSIKIFDKVKKDVLDSAFDEIKRLENKLSTGIDDSEISMINSNAGISKVDVSDETFEIVKNAVEYSILSGGAFDVAIGPLVKLWGIGTKDAGVPAQEEIDMVLPLLDYTDIELNESEHTVFLKKKGMALDLGGIAKGYIADKTADLLRDKGVKSAIINLGGNVYLIGSKTTGDKWRIGLQDPFDERNEYYAVYAASDETIVSSGVYERYFEFEGTHYHHILDYKTGYPVQSEVVAVSVMGERSEIADVISTIVFSLGIDKGFSFISSFPGYKILFVDKEGNVIVTKKMEGDIELSKEEFNIEIYGES